MNTFQISTFTGSLQNQPVQLVNARELHKILQSKQEFSNWIKNRISEYNFTENLDFIGVDNIIITEAGFFGKREKTIKDYHLTLDMAKELCMLERSEIGRKVRRHFIQAEQIALQELPRLVEENKALKRELALIPQFKRDPDAHLRLLQQARQALFLAQPEYEAIERYRAMGLTNAEICKLTGLGKWALQDRITKLIQLGIVNPKAKNGYTKQLRLGFVY